LSEPVFSDSQPRIEFLRLIGEGHDVQKAAKMTLGDSNEVNRLMETLKDGRDEAIDELAGRKSPRSYDWMLYALTLVAAEESRRRKVEACMPMPMPKHIHEISTSRIAQLSREREWAQGLTDYERFLLAALVRAEQGFSLEDVAVTMGVSQDFSGLRDIVEIGIASCRARISAALAQAAMYGDTKSAVAWLNATDERFKKQNLNGNKLPLDGKTPLRSLSNSQLLRLAKGT
jgi:hypothetical protein